MLDAGHAIDTTSHHATVVEQAHDALVLFGSENTHDRLRRASRRSPIDAPVVIVGAVLAEPVELGAGAEAA